MLHFPSAAYLHRRLTKEAILSNMQMSTSLKGRLTSDVDRLYIEYGFDKESLNLPNDSDLEVIYAMFLEMKNQNYDRRLLETLAKQNAHRLVFILKFKNFLQFAIYNGHLYCTEWTQEEFAELYLWGVSIKEIWDGILAQIALGESSPSVSSYSVEERIQHQERMEALEKEISKLESAINKTAQSRRKLELYDKMQKAKKELEELKRG